jgi:hypothetical protein
MKTLTLLPVAAALTLASTAFAQTSQSDDVRQKLAGAHFSGTSPTGESTEQWASAADGTVMVTRSGALGQKAGISSTASGRWSVNDAGQYCLHIDWDVRHGGPEEWCAPVTVSGDGAITLALVDGRKVAVSR